MSHSHLTIELYKSKMDTLTTNINCKQLRIKPVKLICNAEVSNGKVREIELKVI